MPAANTAETYGLVSKTFHWSTALLVLTLIPLGIIANGLPYDTAEQLAQKAWLFSLHKTLGVTVFFVALARIGWALSQPKPGSLNPHRKLEHWMAELVHYLLYGSLVLVPLSGWVHHAATTGFAPIWWPLGQNLPFVPKSESLAAVTAGLHIVFERVLAASIILHVAGALKHHFVDKDATLRRMWFGRVEVSPPAGQHHSALPIVGALGVWLAAMGLGNALGVYEPHYEVAGPTEHLQAVQSEWAVQSGEIGLEITQFGNKVQGAFADWTAEISFDPEIREGAAGSVDVTIAIASLTLGSVTAQAMGADYFAAEEFPTARYSGSLLASETGYVADGALTLRGVTREVDFPFTLEITDGVAQMQGGTTLDRLSFEIGQSLGDETSLGFDVEIALAVTARRGE